MGGLLRVMKVKDWNGYDMVFYTGNDVVPLAHSTHLVHLEGLEFVIDRDDKGPCMVYLGRKLLTLELHNMYCDCA
jgi:hypothetical protein